MQSIALVTQKGGCGKTTLATNLAVAAAAEGQSVLLLDLDPQLSATHWWESREAETPALARIRSDELAEAMELARSRSFDLVLFDTPGRDDQLINRVVGMADFCLIPCQPTLADIRAQKPTVDLLGKLDTPGVFVITRCNPQSQRPDQARAGLSGFGLPVAPVLITNRVAYPDAYALSQGVTEFEPEGKAAQEIRELWRWGLARLARMTSDPLTTTKEAAHG